MLDSWSQWNYLRIMRRSLGLLSSAIPLLAGAAWAASLLMAPVPLRFQFTYPTNAMSADLTFILHGASNLGAPRTNWPVDAFFPASNWFVNGQPIAPVVGTNYVLKYTNTFLPAERFLYVTASNLWYESDPSEVLALPPPATGTGPIKVELAR